MSDTTIAYWLQSYVLLLTTRRDVTSDYWLGRCPFDLLSGIQSRKCVVAEGLDLALR
jgi:hypothetical protein